MIKEPTPARPDIQTQPNERTNIQRRIMTEMARNLSFVHWMWTRYRENAHRKHQEMEHISTDSDRHRKIMNFYINLKNLFHSNKIRSIRFSFACSVRCSAHLTTAFRFEFVFIFRLAFRFPSIAFHSTLSGKKLYVKWKNLIYRMNLSFSRRLIS